MKANYSLAIGAALASLLASRAACAQDIDPCLVGTWKATSVTSLTTMATPSGGEGFTVTFKSDGTQTLDYTEMMPEEWDKGVPGHSGLTYRGTAKGRITTSNNAAKIDNIETQKVTLQVWNAGGPTQQEAPFGPLAGLGPGALGSTASDNGYACEGDTVEYKTSIAADKHPTHAVKLARVTNAGTADVPAPAPPIAPKGKTWLTMTEIKDREQDIQGLWREAQPQDAEDDQLIYFSTSPSGALIDHPFDHRDSEAWSVDMQAVADREWRGRVYICPRPKGTCRNLCRMDKGSMRIDPNHLTMSFNWVGNKHKPDCSGHTEEPDNGTFARKRVVGVSFVPISPGKYISLAGAPAVGNQAAQFNAVVRIAANYSGIPSPEVRARSDRGAKIVLKDKDAGIYEFSAGESGMHEVVFELRDSTGAVFHTDRMRIEVPPLPGISR